MRKNVVPVACAVCGQSFKDGDWLVERVVQWPVAMGAIIPADSVAHLHCPLSFYAELEG